MFIKIYQRGSLGNNRYEVLLNTDKIVAIQRSVESNTYQIITDSPSCFFVDDRDLAKIYSALTLQEKL